MRWIIHWIVNAAILALVVNVVPGYHVSSVTSLLIATLVLYRTPESRNQYRYF